MPDRPLPGWPRVLNEPWAAAYVGLSVSTFRRGPAAELTPVPLSAHRQGYLREDLDAWIDQRAGRTAEGPQSTGWEDLDGAGEPGVPEHLPKPGRAEQRRRAAGQGR